MDQRHGNNGHYYDSVAQNASPMHHQHHEGAGMAAMSSSSMPPPHAAAPPHHPHSSPQQQMSTSRHHYSRSPDARQHRPAEEPVHYSSRRRSRSRSRSRHDGHSPRRDDNRSYHSDRYRDDRHRDDRYRDDRYRDDRYASDRYASDRYASDRYAPDRYSSDRDRYASDRYASDRYASDRRRPAQPRRPLVRGSKEELDRSTTLFVGNFPYNMTERDAVQLFGRLGPVRKVTLPLDRHTQRNRGFVFVEYEERRDAEDAFAKYNDYALEGRKLRLDWDVSRGQSGGEDAAMRSVSNHDGGNDHAHEERRAASPPAREAPLPYQEVNEY